MPRYKDLSGQRFGMLVAIEPVGKDKFGNMQWKCICDCGKFAVTTNARLRCGDSKSCGCNAHNGEHFRKDLSGQKFGKMLVLKFDHKDEKSHSFYLCRCDCGTLKVVRGNNLVQGDVRSCGCSTNKTHGRTKTRLHHIWSGMKQRCGLESVESYKRYGARGITVCDEWKDDYLAFESWALANGYREGLTIDRKDNNGNYCPDNCQWATPKQQARNRSDNRTLTYNGETKTISEWAEITGIHKTTLLNRSNRGWTDEEVITKPLRTDKRRSKPE